MTCRSKDSSRHQGARASLLAAASAVYLIGLWPTWWLRDTVLRAADFPAYAGLFGSRRTCCCIDAPALAALRIAFAGP
jgi:hypothetical protein